MSDQLAPEIALLLPTIAGTKSVLDQVEKNPSTFIDVAVGLFLQDVSINFSKTISTLQKANVKWVCNLPTTSQYDNEFKLYLSEVGMGVQKEVEMLSAFKKLGFKTMAIASSEKDALAFLHSNPDALAILPPVTTFTAGFPSLKLRKKLEMFLRTVLMKNSFKGVYLVYRKDEESIKETQSHILRPRMV
jgi:predicted TIM-barrel enzyme